jgi:DNA-directed RNA polymerase subunit RPC12/RpoP
MANKVEKTHYRCTRCGYKFARAIDIEFAKKCPYCGRLEIVEDSQNSAQKILEEVSRLPLDRNG